MKLLYVTVTLPYGTQEAFTIAEIQGLVNRGHDVRIVPVSPAGDVVHGDRVADLMWRAHRQRLFGPACAWALLRRSVKNHRSAAGVLRSVADSRSVRVLAKNLSVIPKAAWIADLVERLDIQHIHAHWASTPATVAMVVSRMTGVPWSFAAHRWDIAEDNLLRMKVQDASFVRFISADGRETARRLVGSVVDKKARLIHMGVEMPARLASAPRRTDMVLLCPALLNERKGHRYLFEAVRSLQTEGMRLRLLIAGEGPLARELHDLVHELSLADCVSFLGAVPHGRLLQYYREAAVDAVVLPTLHEGIPVSLMEAMAHGVPVVSTRVGGVPELLGDGAGLLVDPKDTNGLARAIEALITNSALRNQIGIAGRQRVERTFSAANVASQLEMAFASSSIEANHCAWAETRQRSA